MSKVFLSGTNGLPGRYGGWDQLLSHLSRELSNSCDVIVHTSSFDCEPGLTHCDGATIQIIRCRANGPQSILYDLICMYRALSERGICIMLGTSGGLFFPLFRLFGLTIILNPDGEEWHRGKWSFFARIYLFISDRLANLFASFVIADHQLIEKRISRFRPNNICTVPYGGDNALISPFSCSTGILPPSVSENNYVFGVCRIEPENNVHIILDALSQLRIPLVFVGNWFNSKYGISLYNQYSTFTNLHLLHPIYDPVLLGSLRSNCNLYVHGHTVGGTNPSLVEALCLGLRVICHDNGFNRVTSFNKTLYFTHVLDLKSKIEKYYDPNFQKSPALRDFFLARYSWKSVVKSYINVISEFS